MTDVTTTSVFADRLDALGPDFSKWPEREAADAVMLLTRSTEARTLHADAKALARLVAEAAESEVPNGFAFRVVAEVASRRDDRLLWLTASPRRFGLAGASFCMAALAIGIALGAVTSSPAQADANVLDLGSAIALSYVDGSL